MALEAICLVQENMWSRYTEGEKEEMSMGKSIQHCLRSHRLLCSTSGASPIHPSAKQTTQYYRHTTNDNIDDNRDNAQEKCIEESSW